MSRHYLRHLRPSRDADRRAMSRVMAAAEFHADGTALFHRLPIGYDDDDRPCRFPAGEDIFTPYGWNQLDLCAAAWLRGETIFLETF